MSELGQLLKKARLERGLSLDDVQEATKIRKRYLEAIEAGDYKVLPGSFYVRAFVKTYAETVGLNPDELLLYYHNDIPVAETEKTIEPLIRKKRTVQHHDRFGKWATTILMWAFVILIIVIIYFFLLSRDESGNGADTGNADNIKISDQVNNEKPNNNQTSTGNENTEPTTPEQTTPEQSVGQLPSVEQVPSVQQEPIVIKKDDNTIVYSMAEGKTVPFELELTDGIWMNIKLKDKSGENIAPGTNYAKGYKQTVELTKDGLYLVLGNAKRAKITINGQVIDIGTGLDKSIQIQWQPYEEVQKLNAEAGTTSTGMSVNE